MLSKLLRLPRKSDARSYEVLHLSRKIISSNSKIWGSKMQPLSGNQRADRLTALMKMSLVLRLPRKIQLWRSSSNVPHLPSFLEMLQSPHVLLTFEKVHNPLRLPRETTSERPKVLREWCALYILTSKCASRHNGVQFFISHLARWLRTRRFSEPTFRPSGATNHWKNTVVSWLSYLLTFSRICIFFLLTLSLLWSSLFYSSRLSDSSHLCFSSVHIVGSLTSKLPSINSYDQLYRNFFFTILPLLQFDGPKKHQDHCQIFHFDGSAKGGHHPMSAQSKAQPTWLSGCFCNNDRCEVWRQGWFHARGPSGAAQVFNSMASSNLAHAHCRLQSTLERQKKSALYSAQFSPGKRPPFQSSLCSDSQQHWNWLIPTPYQPERL